MAVQGTFDRKKLLGSEIQKMLKGAGLGGRGEYLSPNPTRSLSRSEATIKVGTPLHAYLYGGGLKNF
jgi:hypothetical protein